MCRPERGSGFPKFGAERSELDGLSRLGRELRSAALVTSELPLQETLGRVAESGLPALLLQCLYLFFVFPLEKDELPESDVQVQRMFVQVSGGRAGLPGPRPSFFLVLQPASPTSSGLSLPLALSVLCSPGGPGSPPSALGSANAVESHAFGRQSFSPPPCISVLPLFSFRTQCFSSPSAWLHQLLVLQSVV